MTPLESARKELASLQALRDEIEVKIAALQRTIKILEPVYEKQSGLAVFAQALADGLAEVGMTEAIFNVLKRKPNDLMSPIQVRDALVATGYVLPPSNPMATIHTVLKRLAESRKPLVQRFNFEDGDKYCYVTQTAIGQLLTGPKKRDEKK
jgi:hypothetical protein